VTLSASEYHWLLRGDEEVGKIGDLLHRIRATGHNDARNIGVLKQFLHPAYDPKGEIECEQKATDVAELFGCDLDGGAKPRKAAHQLFTRNASDYGAVTRTEL
jgi:hypothetical protein